MDIFHALKAEHVVIRKLLNEVDETTERAVKTRTQLCEEIQHELISHARAEEKSLYAYLLKHDELRDLVLEAEEEHHVAERLLQELQKSEVSDEHWTAKMTVLKESTEHHFEEEEEEVFPKASKQIAKEDAEMLGEKYLEEKAKVKIS